jgi:membrane-associated phospholipid phosphatase
VTGAARRGWLLRMAARLWWSPVVVVGVLADRGSRTRWLLTPVIVLLAASASTVGKFLFRRPRPGASTRVVPLGQLGAVGFPSTHTTCAFAIAGWQRGSRQRRWLHLVAIAIGYLRVRRRAHFSGDVAAGALLGYGIAWQVDGAWSRLRVLRSESASVTSDRPAPTRGPLAPSQGPGVLSRASARRRRGGRPQRPLGTKVEVG